MDDRLLLGICEWGDLSVGGHQWRFINQMFMNKEGSSTEVFFTGIFVEKGICAVKRGDISKEKICQGLRDLSPIVLAAIEIYKCDDLSTVRTS